MVKLGMSHMELTKEWAIREIVEQCLSKGETLERHDYFDMIAPKGVKNLGWSAMTAIEIKPQRIYDTLDRLRWAYDNYGEGLKQVILITNDKPNVIYAESSGLKGRDIKIITVEDLLNQASPFLHIKSEPTEENTKKGKDEDALLAKARSAIKNERISLFLGAGVSALAGVVTWDKLLEQLCIKKKLAKLDGDIDDIVKGRFIVDQYTDDENGLADEFYEDIRKILYAGVRPSSALIRAIAELVNAAQMESIITYNYDDLVERMISPKLCHSVYDKSRPVKGKDIQVYHVHGFIPQTGGCSPIVLGEKEYHKIYQEAYNWGNVEQLHALCRSTCFFIGLSMRDPNLRRLIDISFDGGEKNVVHYAFLRRIEYNVPFTEAIMGDLGIHCIWYEQHEDLPKLIKSLL